MASAPRDCFPPASISRPASGPYREALYSRDYFFLYNWTWYHWVGMLAPLAILAWFWKSDLRGTRPSFAASQLRHASLRASVHRRRHCFLPVLRRSTCSRACSLCGRSISITLVLVLLLSGIVGEYLAKDRPWVTAALAVPLAIGMFFVAHATYPNSPQIELPFADQFQRLGEHAALGAKQHSAGRRLRR